LAMMSPLWTVAPSRTVISSIRPSSRAATSPRATARRLPVTRWCCCKSRSPAVATRTAVGGDWAAARWGASAASATKAMVNLMSVLKAYRSLVDQSSSDQEKKRPRLPLFQQYLEHKVEERVEWLQVVVDFYPDDRPLEGDRQKLGQLLGIEVRVDLVGSLGFADNLSDEYT